MRAGLELQSNLWVALLLSIMATPLFIGTAIVSAVPPSAGILAGLVGCLIVATISTSRYAISGPSIGAAVIVFEIVNEMDYSALGLIVLLSGIFQFAAAFARAGAMIKAVPNCVIWGVIAGVGFSLIVKQLPEAVGLTTDATGNLASGLNLLVVMMDLHQIEWLYANALTFIAGVIILGTLGRRKASADFRSLAPVYLLVIGSSILIHLLCTAYFPEHAGRVSRFANILLFDAIVSPSFVPQWSALADPRIWTSAIALAVVNSTNSMFAVRATDQQHSGQGTNFDRELVAQGTGNVILGLVGGLPLSSLIGMSALNTYCEPRSKAAVIIAGLLMLVIASLGMGLFRVVPVSGLCLILAHLGFRVLRQVPFQKAYKLGLPDFLGLCATFVAGVTIDLLSSILIGLIAYSSLVLGLALLKRSVAGKHDGAVEDLALPSLRPISLPNGDKLFAIRRDIMDQALGKAREEAR